MKNIAFVVYLYMYNMTSVILTTVPWNTIKSPVNNYDDSNVLEKQGCCDLAVALQYPIYCGKSHHRTWTGYETII